MSLCNFISYFMMSLYKSMPLFSLARSQLGVVRVDEPHDLGVPVAALGRGAERVQGLHVPALQIPDEDVADVVLTPASLEVLHTRTQSQPRRGFGLALQHCAHHPKSPPHPCSHRHCLIVEPAAVFSHGGGRTEVVEHKRIFCLGVGPRHTCRVLPGRSFSGVCSTSGHAAMPRPTKKRRPCSAECRGCLGVARG